MDGEEDDHGHRWRVVVDGEEDDHGHRWRASSGWGGGRPWS